MGNELEKVSTSTVTHGDRLTTIQRLGNILAASNYFADSREMAQAAVKVMAGEELGIAPVAAMMGIHIIKGKVALSATLIAGLIKRHGYSYRLVHFDHAGCEIEFIGKDGSSLGLSSFNQADATAAGVFGDMYRKFPRNMYFSRAISNGAKWYCPEVMSGLPVYVPEELGATVDGEGDIVQPSATQTAKEVGQRKVSEMREELGAALAPNPEKPWRSMKQFLEIMASLKTQVGEDAYYRILGVHGYTHANEIKKPEVAIAIYQELQSFETVEATQNEEDIV